MEREGFALPLCGLSMASRIRAFPIVGYRGAPQLVPPGNTMASFQRAIEVGATMIAADVRCTSDDVLVLYNDAVMTIDGRDVPIRQRTFRDLQQRTAEADAPISTLNELFGLASQTGLGLMLALRETGIESLLARAIRKSGLPLDALLIWGADAASRTIIRGLDPRIPLAHTLDEAQSALVTPKLLSEIDADAVTWHYRLLSPGIVKVLKAREIVVYSWTVDLSEEMRRQRDTCGVDGIITSNPNLLSSIALEAVRSAKSSWNVS